MPTSNETAELLGLTSEQFSTRLHEEEVNYEDVVDEVRLSLARTYLAEGRLNLMDVALLLGYVELPSFTRDFERWTGECPEDYRRRFIN